jgi:hypothetical protein
MGIRYYAYPIDADLIELAKSTPRSFLSDDPLVDAWGPVDKRPPTLYLDKGGFLTSPLSIPHRLSK